MPGATDTEFFGRSGMSDTADESKVDPVEIARIGFKAMMAYSTP
jgi:hypothetical protein